MKPAKREFLEQHKSITLIGMSGVGKTYLSQLMKSQGWEFFSCDYQIGTVYLNKIIQDTLGIDDQVSVENLSYLSKFVGQVGDSSLGGIPLSEFKRRQKLYYEAECRSILEGAKRISGERDVIIDSTGSLCEIEEKDIVEELGKKTLFVYLKASDQDKQELIRRAQKYPKPLFFPPSKFDAWLNDFIETHNIKLSGQMPPDDFSRWVFPKLLASRLPKYETLANQYGITIPAAEFYNVKTPEEFSSTIAKYLS